MPLIKRILKGARLFRVIQNTIFKKSVAELTEMIFSKTLNEIVDHKIRRRKDGGNNRCGSSNEGQGTHGALDDFQSFISSPSQTSNSQSSMSIKVTFRCLRQIKNPESRNIKSFCFFIENIEDYSDLSPMLKKGFKGCTQKSLMNYKDLPEF